MHVSDAREGTIESVMGDAAAWATDARKRFPRQAAQIDFLAATMATCGREALAATDAEPCRATASEMASVCSDAMIHHARGRRRLAQRRTAETLTAVRPPSRNRHDRRNRCRSTMQPPCNHHVTAAVAQVRLLAQRHDAAVAALEQVPHHVTAM